MSAEMYAQLTRQIQALDFTEKLEILNILTNSLRFSRYEANKKSSEEKIKGISKFKGCLKNFWDKDALAYQNSLREERDIAQ